MSIFDLLSGDPDEIVEALIRLIAPRAPEIVPRIVGDVVSAGAYVAVTSAQGAWPRPTDATGIADASREVASRSLETLLEEGGFTPAEQVQLHDAIKMCIGKLGPLLQPKPRRRRYPSVLSHLVYNTPLVVRRS